MTPYSGPQLSDLYTLSQSKLPLLKTIPFTAAHTHIAHIWQYPPPPKKTGLLPHSTIRITETG